MSEDRGQLEELNREIAYYKKQLDQMSGDSIRHDYVVTTLRQELKQKKNAFAVLTMLQQQFSVTTPLDVLLPETIRAINTRLGMDRSAVLVPTSSSQQFRLSHWHGYPREHFSATESVEISVDDNYIDSGQPKLVNKKNPPDDRFLEMQKKLGLNFFIAVPVMDEQKVVAIIVSGRQIERLPFSPPLDTGDVDTLTAITALISSILQTKRTMELQVAKAEVEKENVAIAAQRDVLEKTLTELKKTQTQLIQQEKMASLGELTAGIAHEIQNPLNFVNNFSEVSNELLDEMKTELVIGNKQSAIEIAGDVKQNLEKILHHGKRAEAIVKGMLQHSRASTGQKELTDINALADEYLRLAYHGLRAKDKTFNAKFEMDLDKSIEKINVVPQEIGRVILNLINNAFYTVSEKKRQLNGVYEPTVVISTRKLEDRIEVKVKDNGNGIPQKVLEKIFQPFFTTKPTGQGTGLGLSLSYDIITKGHGGELKVETKEGEGSEFIIQLPSS
jgi:signal transduction histidine kinase